MRDREVVNTNGPPYRFRPDRTLLDFFIALPAFFASMWVRLSGP